MDCKRWVASKEDFLFHVVPLAKQFKKSYLGLVKSRLHSLTLPENSQDLLEEAWNKDWIVYAKKTCRRFLAVLHLKMMSGKSSLS